MIFTVLLMPPTTLVLRRASTTGQDAMRVGTELLCKQGQGDHATDSR